MACSSTCNAECDLMDSGMIFMLAVVAALAMAVLFLFATSRRRDVDRALEISEPPEAALVTAEPQAAASPAVATTTTPTPITGKELERSVALERHKAPPTPMTAPAPPLAIPDEETLGVTRRQVLNRGIVVGMLLGISGFGGAMIAFLWPSLSGGFGGKIRVGSADEINAQIAQTKEPYYYAAGRFYINPYPQDSVTAARKITAYGAVMN